MTMKTPDPVVEFRIDSMGLVREPLFTNETTHLAAGYYKAITTDQAEAYKDACVREALEEAAELADTMMAFSVHDAIRALIPQENKS